MKKLNNHGITTIEVIVCFVLIVIITVSMYSMLTSLNEKRIIEGYKARIYTYKNTLTREIQSDIVKRGLTQVKYNKSESTPDQPVIYTVNMEFKDGSTGNLIITQLIGKSVHHIYSDDSNNTNVADEFMIEYGVGGNTLKYPLPELGEVDGNAKDLSINNVTIETTNNVLSIYIGFYHPELSTRYSISIVCPINYFPSSSKESLF